MAALVPVATYPVNGGTTLTAGTLTTASFTPTAGELLLVKTGNGSSEQPTVTDSAGLTWTEQLALTRLNERVKIFTSVVPAGTGSMTVSVTYVGTTRRGMVLERWPASSSIDATPATASGGASGAPSLTLTTEGTDSAVSWVCIDDNETTGARTYRSSAVEEMNHLATGSFSARYAYQAAAAAGTQTIGLTAPTGQAWTMIGIEVLPPPPAPTDPAKKTRGFLTIL